MSCHPIYHRFRLTCIYMSKSLVFRSKLRFGLLAASKNSFFRMFSMFSTVRNRNNNTVWYFINISPEGYKRIRRGIYIYKSIDRALSAHIVHGAGPSDPGTNHVKAIWPEMDQLRAADIIHSVGQLDTSVPPGVTNFMN